MTEDAYRVKTDPDPFEPFYISQAFRVGDLVITSGQAALTPAGELVGIGDFQCIVHQANAGVQLVGSIGIQIGRNMRVDG